MMALRPYLRVGVRVRRRVRGRPSQVKGACGVAARWPDGLLGRLTKMVLETTLEVEMTELVGYEAHEAAGRNGGNSRNGARPKTVHTDIGSKLPSRSRGPRPAPGRRRW